MSEPVHGKASTYRKHKCRCEPCRLANTEQCRVDRERAAKRAKPKRAYTVHTEPVEKLCDRCGIRHILNAKHPGLCTDCHAVEPTWPRIRESAFA